MHSGGSPTHWLVRLEQLITLSPLTMLYPFRHVYTTLDFSTNLSESWTSGAFGQANNTVDRSKETGLVHFYIDSNEYI